MERDPEQLEDCLTGRNVPIERNRRMIADLLTEVFKYFMAINLLQKTFPKTYPSLFFTTNK